MEEETIEESKDKNYASKKKLRDAAAVFYPDVVSAFDEKKDQSSGIDRFWDIYNCKLTSQQMYDGDSQVYVPVVHDAIEAITKRNTSMLFPTVGNKIEVISETGEYPFETMALVDHHVRKCGLRNLIPGLLRRGYIEGQWTILLDWKRDVRKTTKKIEKIDPENATEKITDIEHVEIVTEGPDVTVIPSQDLAVIPATCSGIDEAEMVVISFRFSKEEMENKVEEGVFLKSEFAKMSGGEAADSKWSDKERVSEAGVKMKGTHKYYRVFQVWKKFRLDKEKEPCIIYFGGTDCVLGISKNPYWSGKVPIMSEPVDLIPGSFWGRSKISHVEQLAYQLNDAINMGMDSAKYSVLPIVMTDPVKNPNVGSMILASAAIWETNPNDTSFAQFPALWKDSFAMGQAIKQQIMESMEVNDAMMGRAPQGRKNAQAIAQQSSEAMMTISDTVRRFEVGIMDKLVEWFYELDQQFRDDELIVKIEGEVGISANMQRIPPQQFDQRYFFKWNGIEQAIGAQRVQQMISFMGVLRGMPPQALNGRTLDITPIIDYASEVILGPSVAPRVLVDNRHKTTMPPETEDEILHNAMDLPTNPMDDDAKHIQQHQASAKITGDLGGHFRLHIMKHVAQMQAKAQQAAPQQPKGLMGVPGMGGSGVAGTPKPGAMTAMNPRAPQQPNGAIPQDVMQDQMAGGRG